MSDVKRYDWDLGEMVPCSYGDYVLATDYDAAIQRAERAEQERDAALSGVAFAESVIAPLRSERDALAAEKAEAEAIVRDIGPITCRNGVQHQRHNGCLYCERDAAVALLRECRKEIAEGYERRLGGFSADSFIGRLLSRIDAITGKGGGQ